MGETRPLTQRRRGDAYVNARDMKERLNKQLVLAMSVEAALVMMFTPTARSAFGKWQSTSEKINRRRSVE